MLRPRVQQRFFAGRTHFVHAPNCVEIKLDLDFGVTVSRLFELGLDFEESDRERVHHCLVVLMGGKRVLVEPDVRDREHWHEQSPLYARIYLAERVVGTPVGLIRKHPACEKSLLEVLPYLQWLGARGFPVQMVQDTLNVRRRRPRSTGDEYAVRGGNHG